MERSLYPEIDFPPEARDWPPDVVIYWRDVSFQLSDAYIKLGRLLGAEIAKAQALAFVAPELLPRKKGAHDPAYNAELAIAYELAPAGKKEAAAAEVARRHKREPEAAKKQVQRILKRGLTPQEWAAAPQDQLEALLKAHGPDYWRERFEALQAPGGQIAPFIGHLAVACHGTYAWGSTANWSEPDERDRERIRGQRQLRADSG